MARRFITGFETGDIGEFYGVTGVPTFSSSIKRSGAYSCRITPVTTGNICCKFRTATGATEDFAHNTSFAAASLAISFYVYIATAPSNDEEFLVYNSGGNKAALRLTSSRTLKLYNDAASLVATGDIVIPTATWTLINFKISSSVTYDLTIGGVQDFTGTSTFGGTYSDIFVGKNANINGSGYDIYIDDLVIDSSAYASGQAVLLLSPDADSATDTAWTASTGAKYQCIDEIPWDYATQGDSVYSSTSGANYAVALESCASAGIDPVSIACMQVNFIAKQATSGSPYVRVRTGSLHESSQISASTSLARRYRLFATDPHDAAAWTTAKLDSLEIGWRHDTSANRTDVTMVAVMVEFIPNEAPPAGSGIPKKMVQYILRKKN